MQMSVLEKSPYAKMMLVLKLILAALGQMVLFGPCSQMRNTLASMCTTATASNSKSNMLIIRLKCGSAKRVRLIP